MLSAEINVLVTIRLLGSRFTVGCFFEFAGRYVVFNHSEVVFATIQTSSLSNLEPLNREPE